MNGNPKYLFYATLLDKYQGYIGSSDIYQQYWGFSEDPEHTEEEFEEKQRQSLLDTINRVPFESVDADRGTAFNEVVDCLIEKRKSDKMEIVSNAELGIIAATYKEQRFEFPITLCKEFANYLAGAATQVRTEAILPTSKGDVLLYGEIDQLLPLSVHDIKMTKRYSAGKFRNNWQHRVYPYCLQASGNSVTEFEYNIAHIRLTKNGMGYTTHTEHYAFVPKRDIPLLRNHVEGLIEFVELHRHLITNKKIFNEHE